MQFIKYVLVHRFMYIPTVVMKYVNVVSFHRRGVSKFDGHVASCVDVVRACSSQCVSVCDACS